MRVLGFIRAVLGGMVMIGLIGAAAIGALFLLSGEAGPSGAPEPSLAHRWAPAVFALKPPPPPATAECAAPASAAPAAAANGAGETAAIVSPFGKAETGWAVYAPLMAHEIGTGCEADTPAFAAALGRWQKAHGLAAGEGGGDGRVDQPTLSALAATWLLRRPFVRAMKGGCPASPDEGTLAQAAPTEAFGGKTVLARPGALDAYRRMVAAARTEIAAPPPLFTIASAYRGPAEEAARCADGSCGNPAKARCSAHRTGLAFDVYLGAGPGRQPFSTSDADRLYLSRTPAYLWLVSNAGRFGFVPYPFEPWHWEWTGEAV